MDELALIDATFLSYTIQQVTPLQTSVYLKALNLGFRDAVEAEAELSKLEAAPVARPSAEMLPQNPLHRQALRTLYEDAFVPVPIIEWAETRGRVLQTVRVTEFVTVHVLSDEPLAEPMLRHVARVVKWIGGGSKTLLTLWIYPSPMKKRVSMRGVPLGRNEVNSGVTYRAGGWIHIFRREELLKVLIHELLHFYGRDINDTPWVDDHAVGVSTAGTCRPVLLNEAYTEAVALLMHTFYSSTTSGKSFRDLLERELRHSRCMYYLVLYHYDIRTIADLARLCQHTNVVSYYLIKYHLVRDPRALSCLFGKRKTVKSYVMSKIQEFLSSVIPPSYTGQVSSMFKGAAYGFSSRMSVLEP
jgi:hypothetical protein